MGRDHTACQPRVARAPRAGRGNRARREGRVAGAARIRVDAGTYADYLALARYHYRAGPPATRVRVLRARAGRELVGVLVVSMPTLNGSWRARAWPDMPRADKRACVGWLNREVRTISRVIVDPRYRGLSIARRLVRAYLRRPCTRRTEAVAAMGAFSPFFTRAGMRELACVPSARDRRLARAMDACGTRAWALAEERVARRALGASRALRRAVRSWARAHRGLRPLAPARDGVSARLIELSMLAAQSAIAPPRAFVYP